MAISRFPAQAAIIWVAQKSAHCRATTRSPPETGEWEEVPPDKKLPKKYARRSGTRPTSSWNSRRPYSYWYADHQSKESCRGYPKAPDRAKSDLEESESSGHVSGPDHAMQKNTDALELRRTTDPRAPLMRKKDSVLLAIGRKMTTHHRIDARISPVR